MIASFPTTLITVKRLTDSDIEQYHTLGYVVVPEFIGGAAIQRAYQAIGSNHPSAEDYFADPDAYPMYRKTQFTLKKFPFGAYDLNAVAVDDAMVEAARTLLQSDDIRLTKGEFWAKYSGAIDYTQEFHRDFRNHTLVVPRADHYCKELTTFIYLDDVDATCGPTAVLPRTLTDNINLGRARLPDPPDFDPGENEVLATGPAGSALFYSYDVFHRGTNITGPHSARFAILADYRRADAAWIARQGWPEDGNDPNMHEFIRRTTPEKRNLLDIPLPGHEYWNEQTITDMGTRYGDIDLQPYWDQCNKPLV